MEVERTVLIESPPARVLQAFFDPYDLGKWWQVIRSVTLPRPLGAYALEWARTAHADAVLGQLGGAFHGTVMDYQPGVEFFVADAYWSAPEGESIGPMAFFVRCVPAGTGTALTIRQSADEDGLRWVRYFEVMAAGWDVALDDLKQYLESAAVRARERR